MEDLKAKVKTILVSKDRSKKGCIGPGIIHLKKNRKHRLFKQGSKRT